MANPCNSPEQRPITFGCAHAQQLIWQLFNAVEKGFAASGDTDQAFLQGAFESICMCQYLTLRQRSWPNVTKWIRVCISVPGANYKVRFTLAWLGWIRSLFLEWKVDRDSPTDKHRHLSHLIGLYPGYAIVSYDPTLQKSSDNYTREEILQAASVSLLHRGNGTGPDGDAGWEKVWRAASWAQLGDSQRFYHELTVRDFVPG